MKLTFTPISGIDKAIDLGHQADFVVGNNFDKRSTEITDTWGAFKADELWFEGICVCVFDVKVYENCTVNVHTNNSCWLMNFVLDGELHECKVNTQSTSLYSGHYYSFAVTNLKAEVTLTKDVQLLSICITRKFLKKLLGKNVLTDFDINNTETEPKLISKGNYKHTHFETIINEILETTHQGYIKRIFLESKILELLSVQLQYLQTKQASPKGLNREDIARLHDAKAYIAKNIQTPCSLIELARKTGLNDFKLKKGFKALFGNTVFGYLFELRMDAAYNLLQNNKSVSEVAEIIGYKNPHHFTAAFKKRFGFLPSQVSKMAS